MKRRRRWLSAALIVVTLAACSSDGPLGAYTSDVAEITEQMLRDTFGSLPPGAAPTYDQIVGVVVARRTAFDAISSLTPPAEMAPEHLALFTAMEGFVTASEAFVVATVNLSAVEFDAALAASVDIDGLADVVSAACTAWERRSAELEHVVELGC